MSIKVIRAAKISKIGGNSNSFYNMLDYIPADVRKALSSKQIAVIIDRLWDACGASKAIAARESLENGFVWDAKNNRAVDLREGSVQH